VTAEERGEKVKWHVEPFEHHTSPFAVFTLGEGASGGHMVGALHSSD